jgi:hypothetical protein
VVVVLKNNFKYRKRQILCTDSEEIGAGERA